MKLIFSQQLVKLRKENHFSQDELAEKLFISRKQYLNGKEEK